MKHRKWKLLLVLFIFSMLTYAAFSPLPTFISPAAEYLNYLNYSRKIAGLYQLCWDSILIGHSQNHSEAMANSGLLYHSVDLLTGLPPLTRFVTENVGSGYTLSGLHQSFLNSPGHAANIYNPTLTHVGVGVTFAGGKTWITVQSISNYSWPCNQ